MLDDLGSSKVAPLELQSHYQVWLCRGSRRQETVCGTCYMYCYKCCGPYCGP